MGVAYFWDWEYRHTLRPTTYAQRRRVHKALMEAGLKVSGRGNPWRDIIVAMLRLDPHAIADEYPHPPTR